MCASTGTKNVKGRLHIASRLPCIILTLNPKPLESSITVSNIVLTVRISTPDPGS